ncbi:DUF924-domain-containing protein [Viridothelium virens]|uniref:DUF924-domain-containing protein n=1 Tax=Viridothelium virens TaxID=1048519 RepID=A0A6A6GTY4_VIRVR|nr:DUF924-domain-containing protein [Viridothelium virens]
MATSRSFTIDSKIFNRQLFTQILDFWFSDLPRTAVAPTQSRISQWFGIGEAQARQAFDDSCRAKFKHALDLLGPTSVHLPKFTTFEDDRTNAISFASPFLKLDELQNNDINTKAEGVLSLILLLDQFSRNIFRDQQDLIYTHYDRLSRALIHHMLSGGEQNPISSLDKKSFCRLSPPYRIWFYLPLMHSEDVKDHDEIAQAISDMEAEHPGNEAAIGYLNTLANFEHQHRKILDQFGRYPHRNNVLGRETTPAERQWLEEGGATFGTG